MDKENRGIEIQEGSSASMWLTKSSGDMLLLCFCYRDIPHNLSETSNDGLSRQDERSTLKHAVRSSF